MPMKAGTVADFPGSMAEAIENALAAEYATVKKTPFPELSEEDQRVQDRRLLFVAIAQGVLQYLKDNAAELKISVETTQVTGEPDAPLIRSSGDADVTQVEDSDNLVLSRGTATLEYILTGDGTQHP